MSSKQRLIMRLTPIPVLSLTRYPVKKEMAQIDALNAEVKPCLWRNDYGAKIQQYRDKLNNAGPDKIIAENQKQVDAWKTTS